MKMYLISMVATLWLVTSISVGQTSTLDVVYLKNGSIVKGTIVELIVDTSVRIQTSDNRTFVFTMEEVQKITKEQNPAAYPGYVPEVRSASQPVMSVSQSPIAPGTTRWSLFGGVSLPTGDFAATIGTTAGTAQTGFAMGADVSVYMANSLAWMTAISVSFNSTNFAGALQGTGVTVDEGSWTMVWFVTGLRLSTYVSPDVELSGFGQVGVLSGTIPELRLTYGSAHATQGSASAAALALSVGAGVTINRFALGLRYLSGEPEYEVTATGPGGTGTGKYKQPSACVMITAGVAF